MATECSQEAVLQFLTDRGGRVKNMELIHYFKGIFPSDPEKKAAVRESFKGYVDNIAFVKMENGVKFVCLKKKYRGSVKSVERDMCNGTHAGATSVSEQDKSALNESERPVYVISNSDTPEMSNINTEGEMLLQPLSGGQVSRSETAENDAAQQKMLPGSGYGTDSGGEARLPVALDGVLQSKTSKGISRYVSQPFGQNNAIAMGNTHCRSEKNLGSDSEGDIRTNRAQPREIPRIALIEASPLPAEEDGAMFTLPGQSSAETSGQVNTPGLHVNQCPKYDSESIASGATQARKEPNLGRADLVTRRRASRGSLVSSHLSEDGAGEGQLDSTSMSGSDSNTPKGSRKNFIELMMNSSPQVRRSMAMRHSAHLSARYRDGSSTSDSDSVSLLSSTDYDGGSITLDPLEHAWMMCSADGEWEGLHQLLACEPNLILKRDFVTGFTCLHWAAKKGKPELLALIVNFARQQAVPVNINARSSAGYTPLHLAAMHNQVEVMKLLIGAYDADLEVRDYSGKKACQYLSDSVTVDVRDMTGDARGGPGTADHVDGVRWRLSKVFHSKLLNSHEGDCGDGAGGPAIKAKVLRRKSSLSKMKPRLPNIRSTRTQIVHSASFRDGQEMEESSGSALKSRPKSSLIG